MAAMKKELVFVLGVAAGIGVLKLAQRKPTTTAIAANKAPAALPAPAQAAPAAIEAPALPADVMAGESVAAHAKSGRVVQKVPSKAIKS